MTFHVDSLEAIWVITNVVTLMLTFTALLDARHDLEVAGDTDPPHEARKLTAHGNVRREGLRLVVQLLLLSFIVPGLFSDRVIPLTPGVVALILVPVILLLASLLDTRDRVRLASLLLGDIVAERRALALEASVQENIELTRNVGVQAEAAYHEANSVNVKIAELTAIVGGKEDKVDGSVNEPPVDGAGEAVTEGDAQAAGEVPPPPGDVGPSVDHGDDQGLPPPPELHQRPTRKRPVRNPQ